MTRLVLHGGFPKTASGSIRTTLLANLDRLQAKSTFLINKDLALVRDRASYRPPLRTLEEANEKRQVLTPHLIQEINALQETVPEPTVVISAENMSHPEMPELFQGMDAFCQTEVIFYIRPMVTWIPSAWRQFGLPEGMSLGQFVKNCISSGRPSYSRTLSAWKSQLPAARIIVRPLVADVLKERHPGMDFLSLLWPEEAGWIQPEEPRRNPSLDFSVLRVLEHNPHLSGPGFVAKLAEILPQKYLETNVLMLSRQEAIAVEQRFRSELLGILRDYCGMDEIGANSFYQTYFMSEEYARSYQDVTDLEVLYRCMGVILETLVHSAEKQDNSDPKR